MKQVYLSLIIIIVFGLNATAQFNYSNTNSKINNGTYTDISTTGASIPMTNLENGSSTIPQNIGFNFTLNGVVFTQLMIHADGILKFGTIAPGISTLIAPSPSNSYANVFTNTTTAFQNIVMPLFLDLVQGTSAPEYHILTTGTVPNRVTTIQWKNLRDADNAASNLQHQFDNMEFQVKLYETSNNIEMVYGTWLASTNAANIRGSAIGIKASSTSYISYTKASSLLKYDLGNFEDPAGTNGRIFFIEKTISAISGTTFLYFATLTNDVNVAKLYVDDAVPQSPTIRKNIQALIKNEGTLVANNIPVTLTLSGANSNAETINIASLAAGASQIVSFTPFVAAAKGLQNVSISVNPTIDDRPENNNFSANQTVTQSAVKLYSDDKKSANGFGFNGTTGMIATKIFGSGTRNLSQIKLSFITNNVLVDVRIYEDNGVAGLPGASPIFISAAFRTSATNERLIPVITGMAVTDDYYVVVAQHGTTNMGLRFYTQYPKLPQKIFKASLNANDWSEDPNSFNTLFTIFQETNTVDVGFEAITAPQCSQTNNEVVKAAIRNFSNVIHDYVTNPVTVTGFVKNEVTNTTVSFSFIKNTGTIVAGGRDTVTLLNNYNFTARGNHVFVAKTICAADTEPLNDSLNFSIFTKIIFTGVPVDSICPNTSVTLAIASPYLRAPINFTTASDGSIISQVGTITVKPLATTTYYARGLDYRGCTITDSVIVKVKTSGVPAPPVITTVDSVLSYKNDYSIVLTAPALAGHTITWESSNNLVTNSGTTNTITASNSFGFANPHKAYYTRTADGCSSVFSNIVTNTFATGILITGAETAICDTSFYDNGGPFANDNSAANLKIYSPLDPTKKLKLTINKFNFSATSNFIIYDGVDANAPEIFRLGNSTPVAPKYEFVASNPSGALTIQFTANGGDVGFIGGLTCQTPLQFRTSADGLFTNVSLWESRQLGSNLFTAATRLPSKGDDSIFVFHNINLNKTIPLDQLIVEVSGNMEVTGTNTDFNIYKTITDNELTIKGVFKTNTGTFVGRDNTNILLLGTLINNITMQTDSIKVFENTTPAIISGNGTVDKLIVNSSQGATVNGNVNIRRKLSLINGIVKVNTSNVVTLIAGLGPTITGGNTNSYVEGVLRRQEFSTTNPIEFPLGANGLYRPISLLANQTSFDDAVTYEAEMKTSTAPTRTLPVTLTTLNGRFYHTVKIISGQGFFTNAELTINYNNGDGIADAPNLRIVKDDGGSNWLNIGGTGTANNVGSITSSPFTTFSDFVMANAAGGLNVLPIRLLSFTATKQQNYNSLFWKTEAEINTAYFNVEKSTNAVTFTTTGKVIAQGYGAGNYSFKDASISNAAVVFYRLKMVDNDGKFTYSKIIKLANTYTSRLNIYPNPATDKLIIDYIGLSKRIVVKIIDSKGATVQTNTFYHNNLITLQIATLAKGMYHVEIIDGAKETIGSFMKQ